jgi:CRP-like cAMP-binding protein
MMKTLNDAVINHAFFHGMKPEHLAVLTKGVKTATYKAGDVLFREGEPAKEFYLIQSGKVALEARDWAVGTTLVQNLGAGQVLGWSWLFPPFVWHLQARAVDPTAVIILSGAHLLVTAERNHDFGYELMKRMVKVVIHRLQASRKMLLGQESKSALDD